MCNIHEHAVLTDIMVPNRSGYIGQHGEDFLLTHDKAFVGFSVQIGPEGAVYILDWHDQDICGNSVRFPNSSRIYRITPKGLKGKLNLDLRAKSDLDLVKLHLHDNDWYVRRARTILQERAAQNKLDKAKVHAAFYDMLDTTPTVEKKLRALWSLHVTGALKENNNMALLKTLKHEEEMIRAWSVQFLCEDKSPSDMVVKQFEKMAREETSPKVRLYLASAMQRMPHAQRWGILEGLATHAEDAKDHNIPKLVWQAFEPMVLDNPERSLELAVKSKSPTLQQFVPRRLLANTGSDSGKKQSSRFKEQFNRIATSFTMKNNGLSEEESYMLNFRNEAVIMTQTSEPNKPSGLYRNIKVQKGKMTFLDLKVSHRPHGSWDMKVKVNEDVVFEQKVSADVVKDEWFSKRLNLSKYAGQTVNLHIENHSQDELAYVNLARVFTK